MCREAEGAAEGGFCAIDTGVYATTDGTDVVAFSPSNIEVSHVTRAFSSDTRQLEALSGASCGIVREGETVR